MRQHVGTQALSTSHFSTSALQHFSTRHLSTPAPRHPGTSAHLVRASRPALCDRADMPLLPVALAVALCGGVLLSLTLPVGSGVAIAWLVTSAVGATVGACRRRPAVVLACALAGVGGAGGALGAHADRRARAPQLPAVLDQSPDGVVTLTGVLVEDASVSANGVRLRLAVHRMAEQDVDGAETVALTVGGTLAEPQMAAWRAGRTIRTAATLRRPAHYLNPGVADDRLALARRGMTLVGSVKSGTLVEIQRPGAWREERAADLRAHVRTRPGGSCAATRPDGRRHRDGHSHRGPRRPRSRARETAADCRHLSRHRDLRRQHRRAHGPPAGPGPAAQGARLAGRTPGRRVAGASRRARGRRRLGGARDDHGRDLSGIASVGPVGVESQRLGERRRPSSWSPGRWPSWTPDWCSASARRRPSSCWRRGWARHLQGSAWRRIALGVVSASLATELVLLPVSATVFNRVTVAGLLLNLAAVPLMAAVQVAASLTVLAHPVAPGAASIFGLVTAWAAGGLAASASLVEWCHGSPCGCRLPPSGWPRRTCLVWPESSPRRTWRCGRRGGPRDPAGKSRDRRGVRDLDSRGALHVAVAVARSTDDFGSSRSMSGRATRRWWSFPTAHGGSWMRAACPGR